MEIQQVDEIFDEDAAKSFGLKRPSNYTHSFAAGDADIRCAQIICMWIKQPDNTILTFLTGNLLVHQ